MRRRNYSRTTKKQLPFLDEYERYLPEEYYQVGSKLIFTPYNKDNILGVCLIVVVLFDKETLSNYYVKGIILESDNPAHIGKSTYFNKGRLSLPPTLYPDIPKKSGTLPPI